MFGLALLPPVFKYVMNPRVKAVNDAIDLVSNPDQWNSDMPKSKDDEKRHKVAVVYLTLFSMLFAYLTFSQYFI